MFRAMIETSLNFTILENSISYLARAVKKTKTTSNSPNIGRRNLRQAPQTTTDSLKAIEDSNSDNFIKVPGAFISPNINN